MLADALAIEDDDSDQFSALECTKEPSASVDAVKQDPRGGFTHPSAGVTPASSLGLSRVNGENSRSRVTGWWSEGD